MLDVDKQVTSYNEAAVRLFRAEKEEFETWFAQIISGNVELNQLLGRCLKSGEEVHEQSMLIYFPDNSDKLLKLNIQLMREDESVTGLFISFKDMELLSELENNLLRSMKFGVITNLASSISHEIKNPLSALALHAEILDNRIRKIAMDDKEKVIKSLDTLQNEVRRLNRIIQQFLSLARPTRLELQIIDLNKVVQDVAELIHQQAQEQKVTVTVSLAEKIEKVYGDEDQLKQVLLNILLNAFAAIEGEGKIYIRTRMERNRVFIDVRDTGKGIDKAIQNRIFDLYFTTKKDGGGIGLAICKNIIEMHEGRLEFDSVMNKGTIFTIELPTKDQATRTGLPALKARKK